MGDVPFGIEGANSSRYPEPTGQTMSLARSLLLHHQPHRPLPQFRRIPSPACHRSTLSRNGVSSFPGVVQSV